MSRAKDTTSRLAHPDEGTVPLTGSERPPPSVVLGRYLLERRLGSGAFGAVWLAFDEKLHREVAIKVIPRDDEAVGERATREARAAARLNHPGIVGLYELLADDEAIYLVSELVAGRTLAELRAAGALADRDVARIGTALCDALAHAHERGVIHRDVKPQNVMVVAEPAAGAGFAKLTDFGVAQLVGPGVESTRAGAVVGTLAYMAPEQADGERASEASDVYSLAITLFESLTGDNPVRGRTPAETARRLGTRLPALCSARRDLPPALGDAIDAALDPDPERRPSPERLRSAIEAAEPELADAGGLVEAETLERVGLPPTGRRPRRLGLTTALTARATKWDPERDAAFRGAPEPVARAAAGLAAAGLFTALAGLLGPHPPVAPLAAGAAVAVLVALLPRIGWIAAAIAVCAWLATPEAHRLGSALVVAAVLVPIPLLLPRAGKLWSLPALAPLLGAIGLAPLFVAIAGLAGTVWRRAGLAVAGFLALAAAEILSGKGLLFGLADGTLARSSWETSLSGAASDAIYPAIAGPALAPLALWALFAAILPLVVRGRALASDAIGAAAWAAGLVVANGALGGFLAASVERSQARGALVGSVLGALVAIAAAALWPPAARAPAYGRERSDVP